MAEEQPCDDGSRHLVEVDGENIYLAIFNNGKHEATLPYENRPENHKARRQMDAVMRRLSELHGYVEED